MTVGGASVLLWAGSPLHQTFRVDSLLSRHDGTLTCCRGRVVRLRVARSQPAGLDVVAAAAAVVVVVVLWLQWCPLASRRTCHPQPVRTSGRTMETWLAWTPKQAPCSGTCHARDPPRLVYCNPSTRCVQLRGACVVAPAASHVLTALTAMFRLWCTRPCECWSPPPMTRPCGSSMERLGPHCGVSVRTAALCLASRWTRLGC